MTTRSINRASNSDPIGYKSQQDRIIQKVNSNLSQSQCRKELWSNNHCKATTHSVFFLISKNFINHKREPPSTQEVNRR
jgi:hypothetical protein